MADAMEWYVAKVESGHCEIVPVPGGDAPPPDAWGPFPSQSEAIARRVGLIRANKCKPRQLDSA